MSSASKSGQPTSMSWGVLKRQLAVLAISACILGIIIAVLYLQNRKLEDDLRGQQGQHRVDVAHEFISREIDAVRSDLLYLAEQELLKRFLAGEASREEIEDEYARFAERKAVYDQIRFLDASGMEIVRVNFREGRSEVVPISKLQPKEDRYYFGQSLVLAEGEFYVSDFDLNVEHGAIERPLRPMIRFGAPVFDASGQKRGVLVLNYMGERLLSRLRNIALPGSTLVLNSEGEYLLGPTADDAWGWLLGHDRNFTRQFPESWGQILTVSENPLETNQGVFAYRKFALPGHQTSGSPNEESLGRDRPSLILVSYLPAHEIFTDSKRLLRQLLFIATGAMLLMFIISKHWAIGAAVREDQAWQIAESESRLRTLSSQILSAIETERRSISREIHDDLGQEVTAISLDLQLAAQRNHSNQAKFFLQRAVEGTERLLKKLHEFATRVRPSELDDLGLRQAVESLLEDFEQRTGITIEASLAFDAPSIPPAISENVYRILQESLTNVAKHAKTSKVAVTIKTGSDSFRLTVEDAGVGFDPEQLPATRLGLLGIRERVELLGGEFSLKSAAGKGTCVEVRLPIETKA